MTHRDSDRKDALPDTMAKSASDHKCGRWTRRERPALLMELLIAVIVPLAWGRMVFRLDSGGHLTSSGLRSLKYFTVLSNLLVGAAVLCRLICRLRKREEPDWVSELVLSGATSAALTFLTVLVFLGPLYGYRAMYTGANFWFHLAVPLMAMLEICLLDVRKELSLAAAFRAVLPMLVYGVVYVGNNIVNGIGVWPDTNDWYGFLNWGYPAGIGIFILLVLVTWLTALALRALHNFGRNRLRGD